MGYRAYYQNQIFMSIAMFGGLHIDLAVLKTAENLRESTGQENWFRQVLQHLGKQTRFWKITHHPNKTSRLCDSLGPARHTCVYAIY